MTVWLLTNGLRGFDMVVSRIGVLVFAIFYSLADVVAGVSTGLLAQHVADALSTEQTALISAIGLLFRDPITHTAFFLGTMSWMIGLVAAAVALYRAGAPRLPLVLLAVSAYLLYSFDHAVPYGALSFASLILRRFGLEHVGDMPGEDRRGCLFQRKHVQPTPT